MSDETPGTTPAPEPLRSSLPAPEGRASNPEHQPTPAGPTGDAPTGTTSTGADRASDGTDAGGADAPNAPADGTGAPRPRRRGSRGGRNRRKPGSTTGATGASGGTASSGDDDMPGRVRNDRAAADRGFTSDDVGAEAREEAGLRSPLPAEVTRPKIGDSRPAPVVANPADGTGDGASSPSGAAGANPTPTGGAKRRRRRGGRNRSRSGTGGGGTNGSGAGGASTRSLDGASTTGGPKGGANRGSGGARTVVTAQIPDDDGSVLEDLDEETLERRRGRTRKGRPTEPPPAALV